MSVLTPIYDTREADLRAAVASVRAQAYDAWELVLVDDGSKAPHVRGLLDELAASDPRVRVVRLPKNLGIAGASQHALEAAHGSLTALLDHDDALAPDALLEMVLAFSLDPAVDVAYSDEDKLDARGRRFEPFFKPAWDPVLLLGVNYVGHLFVARTDLLRAVGGFRRGFDGSQDHDLFLRATERARGVAHVPRVLYHWRTAPGSTAALEEAKPASMAAARRAVEEAIVRRGEVARVVEIAPHRLSPRYDPGGDPAVTVVVRATAGASRALRCVERLRAEPRGGRLEVIVVHDGAAARANEDASAIHVAGPAGAARVAQLALGARRATGEVLLLLDEGFEAATGGWLEEMLGHARRPEVGAVGAKLLRPDGRIRSAGLTLGTRGLAGSAFAGLRGDRPHCFGLSDLARSVSAVSLRALMLRRDVYGAAGGLDEALDAFADVDLCLRIAARGLRIVQASQAALRIEGPEAPRDTRSTEGRVVRERWRAVLEAGDRYFPRALSREREDWTIA